MKKYRLVNIKTKEEHICDKITVDDFDYYVTTFINKLNSYIIERGKPIVKYTKDLGEDLIWESIDGKSSACDGKFNFNTIIATSNININIPQIIDYIDFLADEWVFDINGEKWSNNNDTAGDNYGSYKQGYNESQKTYQFTENDIITFAEWCSKNSYKLCANGEWILIGTGEYKVIANSTKELLQLWKSQQPKIVYYE